MPLMGLLVHLRSSLNSGPLTNILRIGYTSNAARGLQTRVLQSHTATAEQGAPGSGFKIHSRVLGNVFYLMAAPTTPLATVRELERAVSSALGT